MPRLAGLTRSGPAAGPGAAPTVTVTAQPDSEPEAQQAQAGSGLPVVVGPGLGCCVGWVGVDCCGSAVWWELTVVWCVWWWCGADEWYV